MDFLEKLFQQGFTLRSFSVYPRHLGVEKYNCAALLELTPKGRWKQFSSAGYLLDSQIALLVEREGKPTFVYKSKQVPGNEKVMKDFQRFLEELGAALEQQ